MVELDSLIPGEIAVISSKEHDSAIEFVIGIGYGKGGVDIICESIDEDGLTRL